VTEKIYPVTVPKWGIEMQEGTVVAWHVSEGDEISAGDEMVDVETDKIVNTMEAPVNGVLRRRLAEEGETLKVGALLGAIAPASLADGTIDEFIAGYGTPDAAASDEDNVGTEKPREEPAPPTPETVVEAEQPAPRRVRVSPAAARRAKELGVDISKVKCAGRRISPEDVERHAEANKSARAEDPGTTPFEAIPMSATRKSIAHRLVEAKQQIPHFYLSIDINMDKALDRRGAINTQDAQKVTLTDIINRAVVLALQAVPEVNSQLVLDEVRQYSSINLAMAVATERGVISPVIPNAELLSITGLAAAAADLGTRARDSSLTREDLKDGTFTVSNLGMYGISEFQAIINPPQVAILALGVCEERLVPVADAIQKANVMRASMSCDHRVIDGALGAQFLSKLRTLLENPADL
jgi:pyruvate dehydrogenase E2 component (dihydrolipoamide acetyltransferase)